MNGSNNLSRHQVGLRPDVNQNGLYAAQHRLLVNTSEQNFHRKVVLIVVEGEIKAVGWRVSSPEGFNSLLKLSGFGNRRDVRKQIASDNICRRTTGSTLPVRLKVENSAVCVQFQQTDGQHVQKGFILHVLNL